MKDVLILAASAGVAGLLVLAVWLAGFRERAIISGAASLAPLLAEIDPAAKIEDLAIDPAGRHAIARLVDGRVLLAVSMGLDIALRLLPAGGVRVRLKRGNAVILTTDVGFPRLKIAYSEASAPAMLRALAGK